MKTIELNNKTYNLPENWSEVTFDQYLAINKVDDINELYRIAQIVSILTGIDYKVILEIPFSEFNKIDMTWLSHIDGEVINEWIIDGVTYKINGDLNSMSVAEFIDTQQYAKDINTYDKLLGVLLRPVGEKYNGDLTTERAKLFKANLSALDVYKITNFFLFGEQGLINSLMTYSLNQTEMGMKEMNGELLD